MILLYINKKMLSRFFSLFFYASSNCWRLLQNINKLGQKLYPPAAPLRMKLYVVTKKVNYCNQWVLCRILGQVWSLDWIITFTNNYDRPMNCGPYIRSGFYDNPIHLQPWLIPWICKVMLLLSSVASDAISFRLMEHFYGLILETLMCAHVICSIQRAAKGEN